jgi:hypothetical protein
VELPSLSLSLSLSAEGLMWGWRLAGGRLGIFGRGDWFLLNRHFTICGFKFLLMGEVAGCSTESMVVEESSADR